MRFHHLHWTLKGWIHYVSVFTLQSICCFFKSWHFYAPKQTRGNAFQVFASTLVASFVYRIHAFTPLTIEF